jgi:hypothetical protein
VIERAADELAEFSEKQTFLKREYHSSEHLNSGIRACQSSVSYVYIS